MTARRVAALLVGALLVVPACGDDGNDVAIGGPLAAGGVVTSPVTEPSSSPAPPTGVVHDVIALDNTFRPERIEIAVGDEVVWENRGLNEHDVLSVESDEWGVTTVDFQPGDVYRQRFSVPGEYRYYCSVHGTQDVGMIGTVVVG